MIRPPARVASHRAYISSLLLLLAVALAWAGPDKTPAEQAETVVAIGDVHGDFDDFVSILQRTGLIDAPHHWTGNKPTLVQVGALLDRAPKPRAVMDLVMLVGKEGP